MDSNFNPYSSPRTGADPFASRHLLPIGFRRHATTKTIVLMLVVFVVVFTTYPNGEAYTDIATRPFFTAVLFVISAGFWCIPFLLATVVPTRKAGAALCGLVASLRTLAFISVSWIVVAIDPASALFRFLADLEVAVGATMTPAIAAWGMWEQSISPDIRWLWLFAAAEVPIYSLIGCLATHTCTARHIRG
jgi:hypothetical protein